MTAPDRMPEAFENSLHEAGHPHMEPPANPGRFILFKERRLRLRAQSPLRRLPIMGWFLPTAGALQGGRKYSPEPLGRLSPNPRARSRPDELQVCFASAHSFTESSFSLLQAGQRSRPRGAGLASMKWTPPPQRSRALTG